MFTEFKHISYSKGLAKLLIDQWYENIWSECIFPSCYTSQKCQKYRQPENGRKIPNSSALLITYFEGFMGLSASETFMDLIASSKKLGPHQARAPVQKVTQVKPKVEKMKDLLPKRLFRSSE